MGVFFGFKFHETHIALNAGVLGLFLVLARVSTHIALSKLAPDKLSVGLVADGANCPSRSLEIGPALVMRLYLVKIDGFLVFVHFVKPKLRFLALVAQYVFEFFIILYFMCNREKIIGNRRKIKQKE